ncbi:MAG TPA: Uma2 family endonuclease [Candidatus Limnocylindria bacterium]|jgi:Uma2 family endonuclease|nr:Uma2 family endonuclease [Candidatus Limnocylindria bacterium]
MLPEIVLPATEPETEWILGEPLQKASPKRDHARIQLAFGVALEAWAEGRGEVGPEWRFRVAPPGEPRRPLVPDLAYVSNERLAPLEGEDLQVPPLSPDVAVEILSPDDAPRRVTHKVEVYLAAGSALVVVVDPEQRTVTLHDLRESRVLRGDDAVEHEALPGFRLALPALFRVLDRARPEAP